MSHLHRLLPILALSPLPWAVPEPPPGGAPARESLYEEAVRGALARAQEGLLSEVDLWRDHSSWENAWEVATEHYQVRTTESRFLAQDVADGLEIMLGHFQEVLGTSYSPPEPFRIWILPTIVDYNALGDDSDEHSSILGGFYADQLPDLPVVVTYSENPTELRMWITHCALHQFLARAYSGRLPTGIEEGLASYFALYWDSAYAASEHRRVAKGSEYIPLRQLLRDSLPAFTNAPHNRFMELGTFFTYLLHHREDTRIVPDGAEPSPRSFADYLRTMLRRGDVSDLPFLYLLTEGWEELEESYRAFDFGR